MVTNKKTQIKPKGLGRDGKFPGPGPGRPKGMKNSVSKQLVTDLFSAYEDLGGVDYLKELAKKDRKLFAAMVTKVLPSKQELEVSGGGEVLKALKDIASRVI